MCFQNKSPAAKKVRQSLDQKWSTPGDINLFQQGEPLMMMPETPVSTNLIHGKMILYFQKIV